MIFALQVSFDEVLKFLRPTSSVDPPEDAAIAFDSSGQLHLQLVFAGAGHDVFVRAVGELQVLEAALLLVGVGILELAEREFVVAFVSGVQIHENVDDLRDERKSCEEYF